MYTWLEFTYLVGSCYVRLTVDTFEKLKNIVIKNGTFQSLLYYL